MSLEDLMQKLRKEYIEELPGKLTKMESLLNEGDVESLRVHFHQLKGSGKTYGIPEISELGRVMEELCQKNANQATHEAPQALALVRDILEQRRAQRDFEVKKDPRYTAIEQALANG